MAWDNWPGKNAEGYADPTAAEAMRRIAGKQSRLAGEFFENQINGSCEWYKGKRLANIEKTPEPMKPLRAPNRQGQFLACYTKAGQPDYKGTLSGGRAVVFEAKHTDSDRIERKRLTGEQLDSLAFHAELGALAFVLVSFELEHFYRVPWEVWRDMKEIYGRQYIKQTELTEYKVPQPAGIIKFLDGISFETSPEKEDAMLLIEHVLDTLVEVGNGVTDSDLHEAADQLFRVRDILENNQQNHERRKNT